MNLHLLVNMHCIQKSIHYWNYQCVKYFCDCKIMKDYDNVSGALFHIFCVIFLLSMLINWILRKWKGISIDNIFVFFSKYFFRRWEGWLIESPSWYFTNLSYFFSLFSVGVFSYCISNIPFIFENHTVCV